MEYYTYAHYTADTKELFYIGKGKDKRHLKTENRNRWWHRKVNKHGGFDAQILCYWETEEEALDHEKFLIDLFEDSGFVLVNIFKARGKETGGRKLSEETRKKMSTASKKKWENLSEKERKEKAAYVSSLLKGKPKTEEHKRKLSAARKGIKVPIVWKPVTCKTTGITYPSLTEAALATECDPSHIAKCCRGKLKKTNNLEFCYG